MKSQLLYFAVMLMTVFANPAFGQSNIIANHSNTNENEPILNLYFLSKMVADRNLSLAEKDKVYYLIKYGLDQNNKISSQNTPKVDSFIIKHRELYNDRIFALFSQSKKNSSDKDHNKILDDNPHLKNEFDRILNKHTNIEKEYLEIKQYKDLIDHLKEEYADKEFKKIKEDVSKILGKPKMEPKFESYYTGPDDQKNFVINAVKLLQELHEKNQLVDIDSISENSRAESLKLLQNKMRLQINSREQKNKDNQLILDKDVKAFIDEYTPLYIIKQGKAEVFSLSKIPEVFPVPAQQQIIINSQIHTAQMQSGSSGLTIPSQSQMIDAMAMFLAKRAKQEAAIWFIDQVRLQMNNPLVMDVFPETIKIIDGTENYKVPTFNIPWKSAIAKDFVEMPRNLAKSPWVKNVILSNEVEKHAILEQSVEFGYDLNRLMTEQYNYRDVIRYFYINERDSVKDNPNVSAKDSKITLKINTAINNSATLLYIITNELFAIEKINGKDVYRLLSYEEIAGLSPQEYDILLELVDLKYGKRLSQINNYFLIKEPKKKEEVSKWIGNILISLSQFDKIRNEDSSIKGEKEKDLSSKQFQNVWSILNKLSDNLNNTALFGNNSSVYLERIKKGMIIYEQFQSNNYVGAANNTFELIGILTKDANQPLKPYILSFPNAKIKFTVQHKDFNWFTFTNDELKQTLTIKMVNNNLIITDNSGLEVILPDYKDISRYISGISSWKNLKEFYPDTARLKNLSLHTKSLNLGEDDILKILSDIVLINNEGNLTSAVSKNYLKLEYATNVDAKAAFRKHHEKYFSQLTNLLSFFGDVLTVKDGQQLAGVIDSYALPPTSYKLKRKKVHSIDLNGYVGAFAGKLAVFKNSALSEQFAYGITAPVGVAFTWSQKKWIDNYGVSLDVVDLGNIVNHYLMTPDVGYGREVHFSEVFSLGTTILLGIRNSPFVLSGGFKFLPLQSFEKNGEVRNNKAFDAGIFHVGLKIDIPLINLYGKDF